MKRTLLVSSLLLSLAVTGCGSGEPIEEAAKDAPSPQETAEAQEARTERTPPVEAAEEPEPAAAPEPVEDPAPVAGDPLARLRKDIADLAAKEEHEAEKVVVQHVLIGFVGSVAGKPITRSQEEAEALAAAVWARVVAGDDFDTLVKEHTDDAHPGIYTMTASPQRGAYTRRQMAGAFGDVGWRLEVGETGVAGYHESKSPFGWHIIKRLK